MLNSSFERMASTAAITSDTPYLYMHDIIAAGIEAGASDIHIEEHMRPFFRIDGDLIDQKEMDPVGVSDLQLFLDSHIPQGYKGKNGDFSFTLGGRRFRGNFFFANDKHHSIALRILPLEIPTREGLRLPQIMDRVAKWKKGLVLVTGPTGSGKSTTIAATIDLLLKTAPGHMITIEEPVEYLYEQEKYPGTLIRQREVGKDTETFNEALRFALRQDPDYLLVGEIRDRDTARLAINASETGHLVFSTLHTNNCIETINRFTGLFAADDRFLVQQQLADILRLVVAQRLVKKPGGGREVTMELLFPSPAVRACIREGRAHDIARHLPECDYMNTMVTPHVVYRAAAEAPDRAAVVPFVERRRQTDRRRVAND